ncbi:MAG TPA: ATP-dependent helicase C-terminal domain-containing protein [Xanthomonadaceae bacterium]|nr:ATP-dependent helicase C-terminal domain-containing protein [Xanthomonadaceae bacterium]
MSEAFPVDEALPALKRALADGTRVVLEAPPGAGKTTRVPPTLLDADWLVGQRILMLEPRRIAARAAAAFMAAQFGERVGETVGYRVRFEARVGPSTRIEVVTEGILARMLQDDPSLEGVGLLIFDEFHERHLSSDLGLALALDVQQGLRPDLRILLMSATLDGERLAAWLGGERIVSAGRSYPVEVRWRSGTGDEPLGRAVLRGVREALADSDGDVLVFLPGRREIEQAARVLEAHLDERALGRSGESRDRSPGQRESIAAFAAPTGELTTVAMLHGDMDLAEQASLLAPPKPGQRRIILATNVAESSLTLPGVRAVVDSGLAREPRFDPNSGFTRLETVRVSGPSATQRTGRAGRLGPGLCIRLWPESQRLDPAPRAEMQHADLSALALEMAAWGSADLRFPDAPPPGALAQARELLAGLGALDGDARITPLGRRMLSLGAQPRLGAMLAAAQGNDESSPCRSGDSRDPSSGRSRNIAAFAAPTGGRHHGALACDIVALLEARDPLRGQARFSDDLRLRWQALAALRAKRPLPDASPGALRAIDQSARGWRRRIGAGEPPQDIDSHALGNLLIHAYPDRIARADAQRPLSFQLANGRRARLADDSALRGEPWLVIAELKPEPGEARILRAAPFDAALLEACWPERFQRASATRFNAQTRALERFDEERFDRLVLSRRSLPVRAGSEAAEALLAAVRELGLDALPWSDAAHALRARVALLREHCPELALPDLSDAALLASLEHWLAPWLQSVTRLDAVSAVDLHEALRGHLDHAQRQALDREAPLRLSVPSGMQRAIAYAEGEAPLLAVKLQELFGLAETPAIARGRVPLTLHLLSPAGRPLQVTRDLKSFWTHIYPEVRKEMKGRYPRHPWPEDPWSAPATHRAKPRKRP